MVSTLARIFSSSFLSLSGLAASVSWLILILVWVPHLGSESPRTNVIERFRTLKKEVFRSYLKIAFSMGSFFLSHLVGLLEQPLLSWEAYPALTQGQRRQDFHLLDVLAPGVPRLPKALPDGVQQQA